MARFLAAGGFVVSTILVAGVQAIPWTNATCVTEAWSFNSYQQSPCLVSAYLGAPCAPDNDWSVYALEEGQSYALYTSIANPCLCNTVQWNLISACAMCQNRTTRSWSSWTANCSATNINIGKYPLPVPTGVSVPHWAYYNFTDTGTFNAAIGESHWLMSAQQSGPESIAGVTSTSPATSSVTGSTTLNLPQPTVAQQSQSSNNTGAIVGGAVGGVLGLAIIGLIAFVVVRKSRGKPEPASHYSQDGQAGYNPHPGSAAPTMAQYQSQPEHPGMVPAGSPYKQYDLSDPTTFRSGMNVSNPSTPYADSLPYSNSPQHQARTGNYTGAPQV